MENGSKRVLGVFAHPDDPEFFCGGTFARWAAEGAQITFVLATSGDKGSDEPDMTHEKLAAIREEEERQAARVLGVPDVVFLRYPDAELQPTLELRRDIVRMIRLKKPDIVVACDPTAMWYGEGYINHPDHRAIGQATLDAVSPAAGNRLIFHELLRDEGLDPHKVRQLYIIGTNSPNKKIDITDYVEAQINALREHKSQIKDMDEVAKWVRDGQRDAESPSEYPRYVNAFRVFTFE